MQQCRGAQYRHRRDQRGPHHPHADGPERVWRLLWSVWSKLVDESPPRNERISRGRAEGPTASARWRGRARSHGDPAIARGQSRAGVRPALPDGGVPSPAAGLHPYLRWGPQRGRIGARRRQQRAVAARAPDPPAVAHVPPRSARGTHLNHPTSLARVEAAQMTPTPPSSVTTERPEPAHASHSAADIDRRVAVLGQVLRDALRSAAHPGTPRRAWLPGRCRPSRAGICPIGMCGPPAHGRAATRRPRGRRAGRRIHRRSAERRRYRSAGPRRRPFVHADTAAVDPPRASNSELSTVSTGSSTGAPSAQSRPEPLNLCDHSRSLWITWGRIGTAINSRQRA